MTDRNNDDVARALEALSAGQHHEEPEHDSTLTCSRQRPPRLVPALDPRAALERVLPSRLSHSPSAPLRRRPARRSKSARPAAANRHATRWRERPKPTARPAAPAAARPTTPRPAAPAAASPAASVVRPAGPPVAARPAAPAVAGSAQARRRPDRR